MINLEDIIAVKRYQTPYPPDGLFTELDKSINSRIIPPDCKPWLCISEGDRIRRYLTNPKYQYMAIELAGNWTEENTRKISTKFEKDAFTITNEVIRQFANGIPTEIRVLITQVNELGSECRVYCHPALYTKLSRSFPPDEINDFIIQDSKFQCSLFLDELFIGKLGGTVVEDFIKRRFDYKLLINDSNRREITDEIDKLFDSATTEISICGWIGTLYLPKLTQLKNQGVKVEFITHKPSEAKNQPWKSEVDEAYQILVKDFGLDKISTAHNIHGRTVIVDNKVLIGSMDLNSPSLTGAHTEYAILTNDPEIVRRMRAVFNSKFQPLSTTE